MSKPMTKDVANRVYYAWASFVPVAKGADGEEFTEITIPEGAKRGRIRGYASVETVDKDDETVIQKGISLNPGAPITLEHPRGIFNTIGIVVEVRQVEKGGIPATEIEADLFLEDPVGLAVFSKSVVWHNAGADDLQMGFSIEGYGAVSKSDKSKIIKTHAHSVAVTMAPRNPDAMWSPVFAKGSFVPPAPHVLAKSGLAAGHVGYPSQAVNAVGGVGIVVPQTAAKQFQEHEQLATSATLQAMSGLSPEDAGLAIIAKGYGLDRHDLAVTRLAKGHPEYTFQQARDAYLGAGFHSKDGGLS